MAITADSATCPVPGCGWKLDNQTGRCGACDLRADRALRRQMDGTWLCPPHTEWERAFKGRVFQEYLVNVLGVSGHDDEREQRGWEKMLHGVVTHRHLAGRRWVVDAGECYHLLQDYFSRRPAASGQE